MTHAKIKYIIIGFLVSVNVFAQQPVKKLHYNYNDNVTIWISNQPCTSKVWSAKYPWSAAAVRSDGEILEGCFNGANEYVEIQWIGGDHSRFPANAFLQNKD